MATTAASAIDPMQFYEPQICKAETINGVTYVGSGILFPLLGESEANWHPVLKVVLYGLGLFWIFMGVGIVCDTFMSAIETITSKKVRKTNPATGKTVTVKVWNDTVANLTLMALGSSAPEILLNVIELLGNSFYSGALGPSTIVGSAAFNLLGISSVCIMAIPDGEFRKINDTNVFAITAFFSIFAYLWILFVLKGPSPDAIDISEGVITFLFFPILVALAFAADIGMFSSNREDATHGRVVAVDLSHEELAKMIASVRAEHADSGEQLSDEQCIMLINQKHPPKKTRAEYRVEASRGMTGGKKAAKVEEESSGTTVISVKGETSDAAAGRPKPKTEFVFKEGRIAIMESKPTVDIHVMRVGEKDFKAMVDVKHKDGTAKVDADFYAINTTLTFESGETEKTVTVQIKNDDKLEDDEEFYVVLSNPAAPGGQEVALGDLSTMTVAILDDDLPGTLKFASEEMRIKESLTDHEIIVRVERFNGTTGDITFKYATEDDTAVKDADYIAVDDEATMTTGQTSVDIPLTIKAVGRYERSEQFRLILSDATGGAKFDATTDGKEDANILTIIIEADEGQRNAVDAIAKKLRVNFDKNSIGTSNWKDQFVAAIYVNGSPEDQAEAGVMDWIMHGITIFWKLLFALIPPTDFLGGWLCFFVSLCGIAGVTVMIGDLAGLLGCSLGMDDSITAITFVALGTSLPDTFASKAAAVGDPYADASIGNVTGSNSVNVFLGLGLPWVIGSIYWAVEGMNDEWRARYGNCSGCADANMPGVYPDGAFAVPAGNLAFSVIVFCSCAVSLIGLLVIRRFKFEGELGGPKGPKIASSVFSLFLWFLYVGLSWGYVIANED